MRWPADRPLSCGDVAEALPALVEPEGSSVDAGVAEHVGTCLRCQAELARYRRLLARLHQLRGDVVAPRPASVAAVLAALEEAGDPSALRSLLHSRAAAYVGGAVVATAAAGAGMFVWVSRRRVELAG